MDQLEDEAPAGGSGKTPYTITVEFKLVDGARERFLDLVRENAAASVRDEPGCLRFDVLTPRNDGDRVLLYEIYVDRAAFGAHVRSPHFQAFDAASRELVGTKSVVEFDLYENAK